MLTLPTTELELIKLAKSTTDELYLNDLSKSIYVSVRRSVAKNIHSSKRIIERLVTDCSLNVSVIANQNQNNPMKREINVSHPCLSCTVDEIDYHKTCGSCNLIKQFNYQA